MLEPTTRAALRLVVHRLRGMTRNRVFAPVLHIGDLEGSSVAWCIEPAPAPDVGLRAEIAAALLSRALLDTDRPGAWLARPGASAPHDLDLDWAPVLARVFAEAGVEPRCLAVVTRSGWYEPLGDDGAHWNRLRIRSTRV